MFKLSLRLKLGISLGLLILILTISLTYFFVLDQKSYWLTKEKESNRVIAAFVAHHFKDMWLDGSFDEREKEHIIGYIKSLEVPPLRFRIVDENFKILASLNPQEVGKKDEDECVREALQERKTIEHIWAFFGKETEKGEVVESFGFFDRRTRAQEIVKPVFAQGELKGAIHMHVDLRELTESIDKIYLRATMLASVVFAMGFLFIWGFLSWFVFRPIDVLRGAAQQVARGDLKKRAKITTQDEFGELFSACNQMTETLASLIRQLEEAHQQTKVCLASVGRALGATLDQEELLKIILDAAISVSGAALGSIMLVEGDRKLVIKVAYGLSEEVIGKTYQKVGEGIAGLVVKEGKPLLLVPGIVDSRLKRLMKREEIKDAISVPLKIKEKVIGVLNVSNKLDEKVFNQEDMGLLVALANEAAISLENARLYQTIRENFLDTIRSLATAIDARDPYTGGHSERVTEYALILANELRLLPEEREELRIAAILHDIGKIGISDKILLKPGLYEMDEMMVMQTHPVIGADILAHIKFLWDVVPLIRHHHERYDGLGYPGGLKEKEIPLKARILALADAFEAMTFDRLYRKAFPPQEAIEEIKRNVGTQFDPYLANIFIRAFEKGKVKIIHEVSAVLEALDEESREKALKEIFISITTALFKQYRAVAKDESIKNTVESLQGLFGGKGIMVKRGKVIVADLGRVSFEEKIALYKDFLKELVSLIEKTVGRPTLECFLSVCLGDMSKELRILAKEHGFNTLS